MTGERTPTNLRMLLIMEIVGNANGPLSPTEINSKLGLPKQTVHRLCNTLVDEGFLIKDRSAKKLRPARRTRAIASGILTASRFHIARRQILQSVADEVGETVNFVMPEDDGMSYIDRIETDWAFRVQLPIGTHVPFHCTASGKAFLAGLPKQARMKMVTALQLNKLTPNTIDSREKLLEELRVVSKQGFAIDNEEFMEGMLAIAVPVADKQGRFHAAVAFHGPALRLSVDGLVSKKGVLLRAAQLLTETIFE